MPTPTIPAGNLFFNATTYTGTGAALTVANGVAGQSFQPDLVWIKCRSNAFNNNLVDSVRGITKDLLSNTTDTESTIASFTSFNSNGFTFSNDNAQRLNDSAATYVAWNWKAGGTAVSNTDGTITSSVSANQTSGFSVVTYTGTGSNGTVGHGLSVLGVAPQMVIVKRRDLAPSSWTVWHTNFSSIQYIYLNLTNAVSSSSGSTVWNSTLPSSSVISLGTYTDVNASGGTYVAYCWAPIAGYSAFGSYTGNGSADGPFIYTGFRPKFVMIKSSSAGFGWIIYDSARNTFNEMGARLFPNSSSAETTLGSFDFLSNGFKIRFGSGLQEINNTGGTYIYACWAENPFKYANAR
jgi:hypothetical protein